MIARYTCLLTCVMAFAGCASTAKSPPPEETIAPTVEPLPAYRADGEPFVGLWLIDTDNGDTFVRGIVAGPAALAGLRHGDQILRVNGIDVDAAGAHAVFLSSIPGTRLVLDTIRNSMAMTVTLIVDERARWSGPSSFEAAVSYAKTGLAAEEHGPEFLTGEVMTELPDAEPVINRIDEMFIELATADDGFHKLPLIRSAMMQPEGMFDWQESVIEQLRPFGNERDAAINVICETLAIECPDQSANTTVVATSLDAYSEVIQRANRSVRNVFELAQIDRNEAFEDLRYLMKTTAADRTLVAQPDVLRGIEAMQRRMKLDLAAMLNIASRLSANAARLPHVSGTVRNPPAQLAAFVDGGIVDFVQIGDGYVVVGGPGTNRYDMSRLYAVIDVGGDDSYTWRDQVPLETQTIFDMSGNDQYQSVVSGPGAAWLGAAVLIDIAGADQYASVLGGCGVGAFGFGFLFDDAGADSYRCDAWSTGAGLYGGGVLIDRGHDTDAYHSAVFSQGVGGPRGIGILIDEGGRDLYRASEPVPSAYDSAGSYMAFSQGIGVGIRPYDFGGVGVLLDLGGDDRYEGGEFSQGGGYYWGVGALFDESGNDLYYGNRYAQGFAAHQAFGMLTDASGDDIYWSMTAAGQAAAWDQSLALLFELAGDDVYRAQTLSQGTAAQQSRAILYEVSGNDIYWSAKNVAQGSAGDNTYHFRPDDPIYSFGAPIDESGNDRYSTGISDNTVLMRSRSGGTENGRGIAGAVIDLD